MRLLRSFCCVLFLLPFLFFAFSIPCVAADSTTRQLTVNETRELFGDSLTVHYFNGSDYAETTADFVASYITSPSDELRFTQNNSAYSNYSKLLGTIWLRYDLQSGVNVNVNPQYISVDLSPIATITDSSIFQCCLAVKNQFNNSVSTVFTSSRWAYKLNGTEYFAYNNEMNSDYYENIHLKLGTTTNYYSPCFIDCSDSNDFTLVTGRATFYGCTGYQIFLSVPVVSAEAVVESGDTSGEHGGSDSGGGTDLTETNGLIGNVVGWLQSLVGFVQGIPEAIAGIFIPSDDALSDFSDNMSALFDDHFGALSDARDIIDGYVDTFSVSNPQTSISVPTFSVPLGSDQVFSFGGYNVNLNPTTYNSNFSVLMDALKLIIDIVCTILVVNGLRNRFEGLLSGGDSGAD